MNYIFLITNNIIGFLCGLLSSIFVARHLGPEILGSYVFLLLILSYFTNFGRFRVSKSILPYLKNNQGHELTIFSLSFFLNALFASVSTVALVTIGFYVGFFKDFPVWIYPLMSLMIFCEHFLLFITYALSFQSKFKWLAMWTAFRPIMQTAGFAWLYFVIPEQKSPMYYLSVNAATMLISVLIGTYLVRNYINLSFLRYRILDLKHYFNISLRFYLADFVGFFSGRGVATLVAAKLAISNLAYFNMMFNHFKLLEFSNTALGTMMYPKLSKETEDKKQRIYISRKVGLNFLIYPPIMIAAYFLYPKLVLLFYGPEYEIITHYFPYILLLGGPYLIFYPIFHYFSANGAPQFSAIIEFFGLFIQITGVILFICWNNFSLFSALLSHTFGMVGCTIALLLIYKYKKF